MPPLFVFNVSKAIQAIGVLLHTSSTSHMNYMRLLKLLYIADRESLRDTGRPITGDRVMAMERGPLPSTVYSLIKGQHMEAPRWNKFFHRQRYEIGLTGEPGVGELSRYEIEKLEEIAQRYEDKDEWEMVQLTHEFPEWKKNDPGQSARPIPVEDILEAVGRSQDIQLIIQDEKDRATFDRLFNTPPKKPQGSSQPS